MWHQFAIPGLALAGRSSGSPDLPERLAPLGRDVRGHLFEETGHYSAEEAPRAAAASWRAGTEQGPLVRIKVAVSTPGVPDDPGAHEA